MASPTKHASPRKASPKKVTKASPKKVTKASPKKVNKVKAKVVKKPASHPKYTEMITAAIIALKNRGGSSRDAIKKYICANYKVGDNANTQLRLAFRRALKAGTIFQKKGISGSFRLTDEAKKQMTVKKPVKKVAPTKKKSATAAKKVAKKISKSKKVTPKKKKPTAKKTSTKKAKKLVGKKPGAKKVKRTPAKKAKKPTKK